MYSLDTDVMRSTNKVGTFDEALKSRIHISLYYKPLDSEQSEQVWRSNLRRFATSHDFDAEPLMRWVRKLWKRMEKSGLRPWNGMLNASRVVCVSLKVHRATDQERMSSGGGLSSPREKRSNETAL